MMHEVRLIDAIELVRYMCGACPSHQNGECIDKMCWKYEDRARIENSPTIEAEPVRHGHWIIREAEFGLGKMYECSLCHKMCEHYTHIHYDPSPYCMHCGARMDGGYDNAD